MKKAFTLTELLVVVGIIAVLAAVVLAAVPAARGAARRASCMSSERQIGVALLSYAQDYGGFPTPLQWEERRWLEGKDFTALRCSGVDYRSDTVGGSPGLPGYAINAALLDVEGDFKGGFVPLSVIARPAATVMLCEQLPGISSAPTVDMFSDWRPPNVPANYRNGFTRHFGGANYLFGDGHAKWHLPEQVSDAAKDASDRKFKRPVPDDRPTFGLQ